jgi:hypothetical protein
LKLNGKVPIASLPKITHQSQPIKISGTTYLLNFSQNQSS